MSKNAKDSFAGLLVTDHPVADPPAAVYDAQKKRMQQQPPLVVRPIPGLPIEELEIDFQMEIGVAEKSESASAE